MTYEQPGTVTTHSCQTQGSEVQKLEVRGHTVVDTGWMEGAIDYSAIDNSVGVERGEALDQSLEQNQKETKNVNEENLHEPIDKTRTKTHINQARRTKKTTWFRLTIPEAK